MAHPNEEWLRAAYDAYGRGDIEAATARFEPDMVWHVTGTNPLAGDYVGLEEIRGFFRRGAEAYAGTFRMEVHDLLVNDEHATVIVRATGQRAGRVLDSWLCQVWHLRDGRAREFWELRFDPAADAAFWA